MPRQLDQTSEPPPHKLARDALLAWLASFGVRLRMPSTFAVEGYTADRPHERARAFFIGVRPNGRFTLTVCTNIGNSVQTFLHRENLLAELVSKPEAEIVRSALARNAERAAWGRRVMARLAVQP